MRSCGNAAVRDNSLCIHIHVKISFLDCTVNSLATVQHVMCTPNLTNQTLEIFEPEVTISTEIRCCFYMLICKARAVADTESCLCDCGSNKL